MTESQKSKGKKRGREEREKESSESEEEVVAIKRNKLLSPYNYDHWTAVESTARSTLYEAASDVGLSVHGDSSDPLHVVLKRPAKDDDPARLRVLHEAPPALARLNELRLVLAPEIAADVRAAILALVRSVVDHCSVPGNFLLPRATLREVISEGETHYFYTIDYTSDDLVLTLPLSVSPPASAIGPISLVRLCDGEMVFTFCKV